MASTISDLLIIGLCHLYSDTNKMYFDVVNAIKNNGTNISKGTTITLENELESSYESSFHNGTADKVSAETTIEKDPGSKFDYDKDNKTINLKKGINDRIKVLSMLDIYTSDNANNDFEKELLKYSICKGIGIDTDFDDKFDLYDWYKKTDFNDVEKSFKLILSKGRKFINNFNKFFSIEKKNFEYIPLGLYEDYNLSL